MLALHPHVIRYLMLPRRTMAAITMTGKVSDHLFSIDHRDLTDHNMMGDHHSVHHLMGCPVVLQDSTDHRTTVRFLTHHLITTVHLKMAGTILTVHPIMMDLLLAVLHIISSVPIMGARLPQMHGLIMVLQTTEVIWMVRRDRMKISIIDRDRWKNLGIDNNTDRTVNS